MQKSELNHISLSYLSSIIKQTLNEHLEISYWVVAEIAEFKVNSYSGHCYLELVEKDDETNAIKARMRGTIWSAAFRMVKPFFETSTGIELGSGLNVMVRGVVEYHETYGLSLNIRDIDPAYTVGEMAMRMQQTIDLLTSDGVIDMNRELELPALPKTIAVVSSSNAAGFQDFMDQLDNNGYGYRYHVKLFNSVMQGDEAPASIMAALERIFEQTDVFDAVAIIRGGGAVLDLSCFNNYDLCFLAAQFPIPILTGIGHEKDETVLDVVAHTKLKTPTALAEFLIGCFADFEDVLSDTSDRIFYLAGQMIKENHNRLNLALNTFRPIVNQRIDRSRGELKSLFQNVSTGIKYRLNEQQVVLDNYKKQIEKESAQYASHRMDTMELLKDKLSNLVLQKLRMALQKMDGFELKLNYQNPEHILKKGYSITTRNGKIVKKSAELKPGDQIKTILMDGKTCSRVE